MPIFSGGLRWPLWRGHDPWVENKCLDNPTIYRLWEYYIEESTSRDLGKWGQGRPVWVMLLRESSQQWCLNFSVHQNSPTVCYMQVPGPRPTEVLIRIWPQEWTFPSFWWRSCQFGNYNLRVTCPENQSDYPGKGKQRRIKWIEGIASLPEGEFREKHSVCGRQWAHGPMALWAF